MSDTAGSATADEAASRRPSGASGRVATRLAALTAALVGVAIAAYGLSLPHVLLGVHDYDDGVYFGASLRFVDGVIPYRDFVVLHPPGFTLVLAPLALLAHLVGSDGALGAARCLTILVAGADCALAALVVRHRGPIASLAAGLTLACFPLAVTGDQTVLLEPYLAGVCLLGAILAFEGGELVTGRRALWAGIAFGAAGSIKIWAAFPIAALLCCVIGRWSSLRRIVSGILVGFLVPCLPFFLMAPTAFLRDVIVDQVTRSGGSSDLGLIHRLGDLTSLAGWPSVHLENRVVVATAFVVALALAGSYALLQRTMQRADWFFLLAAAVIVWAVLTAPEFYEYYAYFPTVFIAPAVGACVASWLEVAETALLNRQARRPPVHVPGNTGTAEPGEAGSKAALGRRAGARSPVSIMTLVDSARGPRAAATLVVLAAAAALVPVAIASSHAYIEASGPTDPAPTIDSVVPAGACAVTDESIVLIVADRFDSSHPRCPELVDSFGTWLAADPSQPPPAPGTVVPALATRWESWFEEARYVVLSVPESDYIPWTPALDAWFDAHYSLVSGVPKGWVYGRIRVASSARSAPRAAPRGPGAVAGDSAPLQDFDAAMSAGDLALSTGHLTDARRDFGRAAAIDPSDPTSDFELGVADSELHDVAAAAAAYRRALRLQPDYLPALEHLAPIVAARDPAGAITLYRRVVARQPRDAEARFALGLLLVHNGRAAAGRAELGRAIAVDPALRAELPASVHLP